MVWICELVLRYWIGDDFRSDFRCWLRSNGVNYVRDFLSHAAAVSQFADGGIKVGKCSGLVPGPRGRGGGGGPSCPAACLRNLAVRLAFSLAEEFEHTHVVSYRIRFSVQRRGVTYYLTSVGYCGWRVERCNSSVYQIKNPLTSKLNLTFYHKLSMYFK